MKSKQCVSTEGTLEPSAGRHAIWLSGRNAFTQWISKDRHLTTSFIYLNFINFNIWFSRMLLTTYKLQET